MQDNNHKQENQGEGPMELGKRAVEVGTEALKDALDATISTEANGGRLVGEAVKVGLNATITTGIGGAKLVEDITIETSKKTRDFWHGLGPGLITGAADDDPSGIATYSQTGAKYGFSLLWLAPLTFPLMAVVQEMCARIGLVSGRGLAWNIKKYFPRWVLITTAILLLAANSFNIGADLGAMAKATQLLFPQIAFWLLVIGFTVLTLFLQIFISYAKYARYLKYLALILFVYVFTAFTIKDFDWLAVLKDTVIPHLAFSKEQFILICGILGTTISPYLFFWETSQEVEEKIAGGQTMSELPGTTKKEVKKMRLDVWVGMFISNMAMFFIIAVCAATLFKFGITNIDSAADAAMALKPLAGNYAYLLFTLGIIGVGLLGVPILAGSASYAISESFGWREGLYQKFKRASLFYGVIIFSTLVGLGMNFIGLDPIKALVWSAVFNGLVAPVVLVLIVIISNNKNIMGQWANGRVTKIVGTLAAILMIVSAIITLYAIFF